MPCYRLLLLIAACCVLNLAGWSYVRLADPSFLQHRLTRVSRADGSEIAVPTNAWTTRRILRPASQPEEHERLVHLIDYRESPGTATYRLAFHALPGDTDCSGTVDVFDIDPFVTALIGGPVEWAAFNSGPCDFVAANDINGDGVVNFFDIDPFVSLLVSR